MTNRPSRPQISPMASSDFAIRGLSISSGGASTSLRISTSTDLRSLSGTHIPGKCIQRRCRRPVQENLDIALEGIITRSSSGRSRGSVGSKTIMTVLVRCEIQPDTVHQKTAVIEGNLTVCDGLQAMHRPQTMEFQYK